MSVNNAHEASDQHGVSLYAALARTATRSIALYFSRPVRIFRPSKVSGWQSLKSHAIQNGSSLSPHYISTLIKSQGFMIIPKHFIPPMLVNAALGTVLWTTYSETSDILEPHIGSHPTTMALISGAVAGGMQALVGAPAENVRLVLEGGSGHGWSHAWKEVFRGTVPPPRATKEQSMEEIRQVRDWMKDVKEMAGRGWDGWGWGFAKDVCGFAAFFAIFDVTRRLAAKTRSASHDFAQNATFGKDKGASFRRHFPTTVHGVTLVTGGVIAGLSYEFVSRPWDEARRTVHIDKMTHPLQRKSALSAIIHRLRTDGVLIFFRNPVVTLHNHSTSVGRRRLQATLRSLARVGPWGVGFLVWEAYGSGLA